MALVSIFAVGVITPSVIAAAAGTARYSLDKTSGNYQVGSSFTVTIHEFSSDPVAFAQMNLDYDAAKLQVDSLDVSNKTFDSIFTKNSDNGIIKLYEAKTPGSPATGDQILGSVTFTVLSAGTTSLSFDSAACSPTFNCTQIYEPLSAPPYSQDIWDGNTTGGTYTLTSSSGGSGGTTTNTPPNNTSTPKKTGTSSNTSTGNSTSTPDNQIVTASTSENGYLVTIKVTNSDGTAVKSASVTLDGKPAVSFDSSGTASFVNISAGSHTVMVEANGKKISKTINVATGPYYKVQNFSVQFSNNRFTAHNLLIAGGAVLALILIIVIFSGINRKLKSSRELSRHIADTPPPSATPASTTVTPQVGNIENSDTEPTDITNGPKT